MWEYEQVASNAAEEALAAAPTMPASDTEAGEQRDANALRRCLPSRETAAVSEGRPWLVPAMFVFVALGGASACAAFWLQTSAAELSRPGRGAASGARGHRGHLASNSARLRSRDVGKEVTEQFDCGLMEDGVDYLTRAFLYQIYPIKGAEECRDQCNSEPRCGAWTWGKARGKVDISDICFLKALGGQEVPEQQRNGNLISGVACTGDRAESESEGNATGEVPAHRGIQRPRQQDDTNPKCGAIEDDVDYWTDVPLFKMEPVLSAESCRDKCQRTKRCAVWTWGKPGGLISLDAACFLKGAGRGEQAKRHEIAGVMSGLACAGTAELAPETTQQPLPDPGKRHGFSCDLVEENVVYVSGEHTLIELSDISGADLCARYCRGHARCGAWSWALLPQDMSFSMGSEASCKLLAEAHPRKVSSRGAVSGLVCHDAVRGDALDSGGEASRQRSTTATTTSATSATSSSTSTSTEATQRTTSTTPQPSAGGRSKHREHGSHRHRGTSHRDAGQHRKAKPAASRPEPHASPAAEGEQDERAEREQEAEAAEAAAEKLCMDMERNVDFQTQESLYDAPNTASADDCRSICTKEKDCDVWSWGELRGSFGLTDVCFLKAMRGGVSPTRITKHGVVSGFSCRSRHLGPTTTPFPDSFPANSLYCIALMQPQGYEPELIRLQYQQKVSVFACDEYAVYSSEVLEIAEGLLSRRVDSDLKCKYGGEFKTALNTRIFFAVWKEVIAEGRFRLHAWTIKVDPDCVFLVPRLRQVLLLHEPSSPKGLYLNNCRMGLHGPLEVLSTNAVEAWWKGKDTCLAHFKQLCSGDCFWGEDMFMDQCLSKVLKVPRSTDKHLLVEDHCKPPAGWETCEDKSIVAFHPFKTKEGYVHCLVGSGVTITSGINLE